MIDRGRPLALTDALLLDADTPAAPGTLLVREGVIVDRLSSLDPIPDDAVRRSLGGRLLLPGFCDAHAHVVWIGLEVLRPSLLGASSREEALDLLRGAAASDRTSASVLAEGWDEGAWPEGEGGLLGSDLDAVEPDRPVVARRVCHHVAAANAPAMRLIPDGRGVDRSRGLLFEDAAMRVVRLLPGRADERRRALEIATARAHALGVTTIHDLSTDEDLELLAERDRDGALGVRVRCFLRAAASPGAVKTQWPESPFLRVVGAKLFADGSIGARTAAVSQPYAEGGRGRMELDPPALLEAVRAARARGVRLAVHAIGDRALDRVLDALEAAGAHGQRIEHAELLPPGAVERMAGLGVTASMQPNFVSRWAGPGGLYARALGAGRARASNRFASLARGGVRLAFGSDAMPFGPLAGIGGALFHPDPRERMGVVETLAAYTRGGPRSIGEAAGTLAPGMPADLVALDVTDLEPASVAATSIHATWIDGRAVYEAEGAPAGEGRGPR